MDQAETFYNELKQLRVAQGISLEDISARTRINVRFLEALEQGELDILPKTYMRLFLRSYCWGIGANEQEALEQLEKYLGEPEDQHAATFEELSATALSPPQAEGTLELEARGPARLRRDFIVGAGIFLLLIVITFFARRVYQVPISSDTTPATSIPTGSTTPSMQPSTQLQTDVRQSNTPATSPTTEAYQPVTTPPPAARSQPVVPEESAVELTDVLFTEDRIVSHHMQRVRLTPPVRLTLRARDNVIIQPVINGQRGQAINLTVAEARIWTIQDELVLRTTAIDLLRGDLNGVPINIGQAHGIGILRVTATGEYEIFAYADTTP